jgi:hypothetical protein
MTFEDGRLGYLRVLDGKLELCAVLALLRTPENRPTLAEIESAPVAFIIKVYLRNEAWSVLGNIPVCEADGVAQLRFWQRIVGREDVVRIVDVAGVGLDAPISAAYGLELPSQWPLDAVKERLRRWLDGDDYWMAELKKRLDERSWIRR